MGDLRQNGALRTAIEPILSQGNLQWTFGTLQYSAQYFVQQLRLYLKDDSHLRYLANSTHGKITFSPMRPQRCFSNPSTAPPSKATYWKDHIIEELKRVHGLPSDTRFARPLDFFRQSQVCIFPSKAQRYHYSS